VWIRFAADRDCGRTSEWTRSRAWSLLSTIGEALKIDLDIEEAMGIQTVDDACAFVTRKYKEQKADGGPCVIVCVAMTASSSIY